MKGGPEVRIWKIFLLYDFRSCVVICESVSSLLDSGIRFYTDNYGRKRLAKSNYECDREYRVVHTGTLVYEQGEQNCPPSFPPRKLITGFAIIVVSGTLVSIHYQTCTHFFLG